MGMTVDFYYVKERKSVPPSTMRAAEDRLRYHLISIEHQLLCKLTRAVAARHDYEA